MNSRMTIYRDCGILGEEVEFEVFFYYSYDKGCRTLPNGDPGYPAETIFEVTKVLVLLDGYKIDVTENMSSKLEDDLDLQANAHDIWLEAKNGGEF